MVQERITRSNTIQFQPLSIYFPMESETMCSSPLPITLNSLPLPYLTGYNCIISLYWVARENGFFVKNTVPQGRGRGQAGVGEGKGRGS